MTMVIAELSANHGGSKARMMKLIKAAAKAGADAVKFQTFSPLRMVADDTYVLRNGPWKGKKLLDLYRKAWTPTEWHGDMFELAHSEGLIAFSSAYDPKDVDFLEFHNCPVYKISSFEICHTPLLERVAQTKKPVILSTGMADEADIASAVVILRRGCKDITLLKCTSAYPAPVAAANLETMVDMRTRFKCDVGLSDHSIGHELAVAAAYMGAKVIEKHLRLDNKPTLDSRFSMDPKAFAKMVKALDRVELLRGGIHYGATESEASSSQLVRSVYATNDIRKGEVFRDSNIGLRRPGMGLHPRYLPRVIGNRAPCDIKIGTPINKELGGL